MGRKREMLLYMQSCLWDDLAHDIRFAINGRWSIAAEGTVQRIVWVSRVVGMSDAGKVSIPMLKSGVYDAVCHLAQVEPVIDFNLDDYVQHWGDYQGLARAVPHIIAMSVEEFVYE
jgi:hypothetical protein